MEFISDVEIQRMVTAALYRYRNTRFLVDATLANTPVARTQKYHWFFFGTRRVNLNRRSAHQTRDPVRPVSPV